MSRRRSTGTFGTEGVEVDAVGVRLDGAKSQDTGPRKGPWRVLRWAGVLLVAAVVAPPLVGLLIPGDERSFEAVGLSESTFAEVGFRNEAEGLDLAGMLFEPDGDGPHPGAVIIHGSGTSTRDNGWYLTIASYLQERGIAVLLPDKRGSERSDGDWRTASMESLATDTDAAVSFLLGQDDVPLSSVGVVGMSQGGRIAPVVASGNDDISWVVNVVGGALPYYESLRYEETHNLRDMGFLPGVSEVLANASSWMLINVRDVDFWSAVGNFDPLPYWEDVAQPSLIVYGAEDTNVPTGPSVDRLEQLAKTNIEISVYEGSGHAIEDPEGAGRSIFREDALEEISGFILRHSG